MVLVEFTGREEITKAVFDTTDEKAATEAGLTKEGAIYRPVAVFVGDGELIKGLDEAIEEMKEGEEKTITISPEKAFGERNAELVTVLPLQEFKKRKMQPYVGLIIEADDRQGRVQSVSGGRVRVDFNNPLAGKNIEYTIKVVKEIKKDEDKAKELVNKFLPLKDKTPTVKVRGNEVIVTLPAGLPKEIKPLNDLLAKTITNKIKSIEKVSFEEETEKKEDKKTEHKKNEKPKKESK